MSDTENKISKYQRFETQTISRVDIKNAAYNPRQITKDAEKALRKGLKEHGLVAPITWNRRTGNVVGGHQRLKQLDALEKCGDYDLTVAVIDVDEREEAALNVQLNNQSMMGEWDLDKLADMAEEFDLDFDSMGFTASDVDILFDGDDRFSDMFDSRESEGVKADIQSIRAEREKANANERDKNQVNWYTTIVFEDEDARADFMRRISVPLYEQYVTLEQVGRAFKPHN